MSRLGVQSAFVILGVIFAVLIIGFGTFVNPPPERIGCGVGAVDDKSCSPPQDLSNNSHEALIDRSRKQMLLYFRFWLTFRLLLFLQRVTYGYHPGCADY